MTNLGAILTKHIPLTVARTRPEIVPLKVNFPQVVMLKQNKFFTPKECQILPFVLCSAKTISRIFSISVKTVEKHVTHIMIKLEIHSKNEIPIVLIRQGIFTADYFILESEYKEKQLELNLLSPSVL